MAKPTILLVEDSAVHRKMLLQALEKTGRAPKIVSEVDAEGGWAQVERMRRKPRQEWHRMAIVDIGLPGMSGIEFVDRIRHERDLQDWPILMLTASTDPDDVSESRMAKATGYVVKPATAAGYVELANDIVDFWLPRAEGEGASRLPNVKKAADPKETKGAAERTLK